MDKKNKNYTVNNAYYKNYEVCNNCGKSGHLFHKCKLPITSIGVITFRICPSDNESDPYKIQYLLIRRKETLGYIDFMRGKYSVHNKDYIMNMLKQMTRYEKEQLTCGDFEKLWKNIWGDSNYSNQYRTEEIVSKEKYNQLFEGTTFKNEFSTLNDLIEESNNFKTWEEPEWGFPKGRRNNQENDYDCAIREFCEETGYPEDYLIHVQNIVPFEEIFTGSNYKSYKHKYFLMFMNYEKSLQCGDFQKSEVSKMEWKNLNECLMCFRPYNLEKIRIIKNIDTFLEKILA
jgi:ADP-ribose pyrophosphatase YjhB (NUDIX family)